MMRVGQEGLDLRYLIRRRTTTLRGLDLETIPIGWIVAGRDHYPDGTRLLHDR